MSEAYDGFTVPEKAALMMDGAEDEQAVLRIFRQQLEASLRARLGDGRASEQLAGKFVDIIAQRRREIALSRGSNPIGVQ